MEGSPENPPPCTETEGMDPDVRDFLPVTFSHPVDAESLTVDDFEVVLGTIDGAEQQAVTPACATLAPAVEPDELQTVLLVGDFTPAGSPALGPVAVNVVGDLVVSVDGMTENVNGLCAHPASTIATWRLCMAPLGRTMTRMRCAATSRPPPARFCSRRWAPAS